MWYEAAAAARAEQMALIIMQFAPAILTAEEQIDLIGHQHSM